MGLWLVDDSLFGQANGQLVLTLLVTIGIGYVPIRPVSDRPARPAGGDAEAVEPAPAGA